MKYCKNPRAINEKCSKNMLSHVFFRYGERRGGISNLEPWKHQPWQTTPIWIRIISMSLLCIYSLMLIKTIFSSKNGQPPRPNKKSNSWNILRNIKELNSQQLENELCGLSGTLCYIAIIFMLWISDALYSWCKI